MDEIKLATYMIGGLLIVIGLFLIGIDLNQKNTENIGDQTLENQTDGSELVNATVNNATLNKITITSNKELFASGEIIVVTLNITSNQSIETKIECNGVSNKLKFTQIQMLERGNNTISFDHKLPRCNVCGGIKPGKYNITCEVNELNITNWLEIDIR